MILQEKIQKKAKGFGKLAPAFLEGAKFALENQWISVENDLPCNHKELIDREIPTYTLYVLVTYKDGTVFLSRMVKTPNGNWIWLFGVSHWMPIPKLPNNQTTSL